MLNEYIHKPSFLKGVKVGLAIKRKKRVIDEVVTASTYLYGREADSVVSYNGVTLPDIETVPGGEDYPYAAISYVSADTGDSSMPPAGSYMLVVFKEQYGYNSNDLIAVTSAKYAVFSTGDSGWSDFTEESSMIPLHYSPVELKWTSVDLTTTDGTTYLSASDPVKSYDADVIIDGVGYKGAVLPKIPEVEGYPYAILNETVTDFGVGDISRSVLLYCFAANAYYFTSGNKVYFGGNSDGEQVAAKRYRLTDDTWVLDGEYDNHHIQVTTPEGYTNYGTTVTTFWANFKAEYDSTVYIDPSDPIPVGEPIGYSYNGTVLPELPEWDKTAYPYAVVSYRFISFKYVYRLYLVDSKPYAKQIDGNVHIKCVGNGIHYDSAKNSTTGEWGAWTYDGEDEWLETETMTLGIDGTGYKLTWTNSDLAFEDGTIYIAASEPIPVYVKE